MKSTLHLFGVAVNFVDIHGKVMIVGFPFVIVEVVYVCPMTKTLTDLATEKNFTESKDKNIVKFVINLACNLKFAALNKKNDKNY